MRRNPPDPRTHALKTLANELLGCHELAPQRLRHHLAAAQLPFHRATQVLLQLSSCGQDLLVQPEPVDGSGTPSLVHLLLQAVGVLQRCVSPDSAAAGGSGRTSAAAEWTWTRREVEGVSTLVAAISSGLSVVDQSVRRATARGGGALVAAHQASVRIAEGALCPLLVTVMQRSRHMADETARDAIAAVSVAVQLLHLACVAPPVAQALLPDLWSTHLVLHTCYCIETVLLSTPTVANKGGVLLRVLLDALYSIAQADPRAESELAHLVLATPNVGSTVLRAFKLWGRAPLPKAFDGLHIAIDLTQWILSSPDLLPGGSSPASSSATTQNQQLAAPLVMAEHIAGLVHATTRHWKVVPAAVATLPLMWRQLPADQRGRAFAHVTLLVRRILDATRSHLQSEVFASSLVASHCRPSAPHTVRSFQDSSIDAATAPILEAMAASGQDVLLLARTALRVLYSGVEPDARERGVSEAAPLRATLQPRALMAVRGKVSCSLEALVRASGQCALENIAQLVQLAGSFTTTIASLLCGDPQAPTVEADTLSMASTLRKQLRHQLLSAARPRASASALLPGEQPGTGTTADAGQAAVHAGVTAAVTLLRRAVLHGPKAELCMQGAGAALLYRRSLVLQVLPQAVRSYTAALMSTSLQQEVGELGGCLLSVIAAASAAGMAALTAAAGAPRLLHAMLAAAGPPCRLGDFDDSSAFTTSEVRDLDVAALCVAALLAAGSDEAWQAESRRLQLSHRVAVLLSALDPSPPPPTSRLAARDALLAQTLGSYLPHYAPGLLERLWPAAEGGLLGRALVDAAAKLCVRDMVSAAITDACPATPAPRRTLHDCILEEAVQQQEAEQDGGRSCFLVGCWSLRCTNLDGDSEAALKTSTCGGCRLVRYCSKECQRSDWRSGHQAACLSRQRTHLHNTAAMVSGEEASPQDQAGAGLACSSATPTSAAGMKPAEADACALKAATAAAAAAAAAAATDAAAAAAADAAAAKSATAAAAAEIAAYAAKAAAADSAAYAAAAAAARVSAALDSLRAAVQTANAEAAVAAAAADAAAAVSAAAAGRAAGLRAQLALMLQSTS